MSMSDFIAPVPMIPVLDDRLVCPSDGAPAHRIKIECYNELLESIFIRELELSKLKAGLSDMRTEIVEDAQTFDNHGALLTVVGPAREVTSGVTVDSASGGITSGSASSAGEGSDSDGSAAGTERAVNRKRKGGKGKYKGKGRERAQRISGEEMGAHWDYEVNPSKRNRARCGSDASAESDDE